MAGFIQGVDRGQATLLPECLEDWADESNPVRVIDAFVDALDLRDLGFSTVAPADTGRPGYHPAVMLKLYIYGYLNRIHSSRRVWRSSRVTGCPREASRSPWLMLATSSGISSLNSVMDAPFFWAR